MTALRRVAFAVISGVVFAVVAVAVQDAQRETQYHGWTGYTPDGPVEQGYWDLETPAGKIAIVWFIALVVWLITQRRVGRRQRWAKATGRL